MASLAALTSVAVEGILSCCPPVVIAVEVEGAEALGPEGADIVCRTFGKRVEGDYATATWLVACGTNRISFSCVCRISLKKSYASLI